MAIYRCIAPDWLLAKAPNTRKVLEGEFDNDYVRELNQLGYNIYFLPNHPSVYDPNITVDGSHIDVFSYVFVDMDLKDGVYQSKEEFIEIVREAGPEPTLIVDSGGGVHVYWAVSDLDAMSFLRLNRRLCRKFNTDEATGKIYQLMRAPGTNNTKIEGNTRPCNYVYSSEAVYSCEDLDSLLPALNHDDEAYCQAHFNKTYGIGEKIAIKDELPKRFDKLIRDNPEAKSIWAGEVEDRSKADYRLGHLMFANGFTKDEALSVLVNSIKARDRAPQHRVSYATGIVDKIWTFENTQDRDKLDLSMSVKDILAKGTNALKGTRFPCNAILDATAHGFRLGQVIGLVAGSGVGKTAMSLNMFRWFAKENPDYVHFFIPLEQPAHEIAERWSRMCAGDERLHEKVHIMSNYDEDGGFRHLSFTEIKDYLLKFQSVTGKKIGCVVIDHIGALRKKGKDGENQDIMDICHSMKAFAVETNTLLVMQSQSSRDKAGIGDLEINKDAAYGTVYFESYCDYLITIWQPLKRMYDNPTCPSITAFKFCKIRHKNRELDAIQEDVPYLLHFDPSTELMDKPTQEQLKPFDFFAKQALNKRKADRKTDAVPYKSISWTGDKNGNSESNSNATGA